MPPSTQTPSMSTRTGPDQDTDPAARAGSTNRAAALGKLVHDLRNPLNTLTMNLELMSLVTSEQPASEEFGEGLAAMERAVEELERGLARIEAHAGAARGGGRSA